MPLDFNPNPASRSFIALPDLKTETQSALDGIMSKFGLGQKQTQKKVQNLASIDADTEQALYLSDAFFAWHSLSGDDYRKLYGYEFIISQDDQIVSRLPMPIAPTAIQIGTPAATNLSVTMKGIVEEHNGAPIRPISISGVSGVMHTETPKSGGSVTDSVVNYLFKNTIQSVQRVGAQAERVAAAFSGNPAASMVNPPLNDAETSATNALTRSGYYYLHNLARFFDYYLAIKKTEAGKKYRLHFNMYKDKMYYDVTLQGYNVLKQAGSLEYGYNISLMAWRRRKDPVGSRPEAQTITGATRQDSLNALAAAINTVRQSRILIAQSARILSGIRSDLNDSLVNPIRETILLGKDILNLGSSVLDFPQSIVASIKGPIESALREYRTSNSQLAAKYEQMFKDKGLFGEAALPGSSAMAVQIESRDKTNLPDSNGGEESASPIDKVFQSPIEYAEFFDSIRTDELQISPEVQDAMQEETDRVRNLSSEDLRQRLQKIRSFITSVCEALGGGDATYNALYQLPPPKTTLKKLNLSDVLLISALNDSMIATENLISIIDQSDRGANEDYYTFYQNYALSNGLDFNSAQSKFYVPFPFGASLDSLAAEYLGDSSRWIEISALNGLRAPYVDEEGFEYNLINNGNNSNITVSSAANLFIGQVVTIRSNTQPAKKKRIARLDYIDEMSTIVTFDGNENLNIYKVSDQARIKAYLPNTVNSLMLIAIPSTVPTSLASKLKLYPGVNDLNTLAYLSKTDLMLQTDGDIIFSSGGDVQMASGLTNLSQAAILKLRTKQGSMLQHPYFGNPIQVGDSVADLDGARVLEQLNKLFLQDPRFTGILSGQYQLRGPAASMSLLIGVSNTDVNLPITTNLPL